ncbi:MAG: hypothetical protein ABJL55_20225 [Roseibium sp.]
MADYYSILKKTIASLPESNGAARRSVYSRARNAIVNQLKAYEPPLSPSEITSEQLRLEEAIRKVEAEAARESLGLSSTPAAAESPQTPAGSARSTLTAPAEQSPAVPASPPPAAAAPVAASSAAQTVSQGGSVHSPLKETLTEAQALGTAANKAVQNAKDAIEPSVSQAPAEVETRREPAFSSSSEDENGLFESGNHGETDSTVVSGGHTEPELSEKDNSANGRSRHDKQSASSALRGDTGISRILPVALAGILTLAVLGVGAYFFLSGEEQTAGQDVSEPAPTESASAPEKQPEASEPVSAAVDPVSEPGANGSKNTDRLTDSADEDVVAPDARTVTTTTINPQPSEETAPSQPSIVTNVESTPPPEDPAPVSDTQTPTDVTVPAVVAENSPVSVAPEEAPPSSAAASEESSVQRSILYEEGEESGGAGTAAQGAVVWEVAEETGLDGKAHAVLSASVEIPERDINVSVRIKPNDDTSLPASHLVEIKYEFPDDFASGDIVNVPGLVMKPTEEARGDALIGASVKVSPGYFWIALSSLPNEQQRNLALLRERGWIDIPMLYENGKRGILTLEKGSIGSDAVEKAVSAWQAG